MSAEPTDALPELSIDERVQAHLVNARDFARSQFPLLSEKSQVDLIVAYLEAAVRMSAPSRDR